MISPAYVQMMADYNGWQNESLYSAADRLSDEDRRKDHGAFFGSVQQTLSHILWADRLWMSRFSADIEAPSGGIPQSADLVEDWAALKTARREMDGQISAWAKSIRPTETSGDLIWYSVALEKEITRPRAMLIAHIFNHQTHHRGQAHAMLTKMGAKPDDTDIPFMPGL